jgi:SAM-dependent methyltransferase
MSDDAEPDDADLAAALAALAPTRRAQFDAGAEAYDAYRPGYPEDTFADLMSITGLAPGDQVIEVGSGTGKATEHLVGHGLSVTCIEPGVALTEVARRKLSGRAGVSFVATRFEDWDIPGGGASAVVSANAWHWIDPEVGFAKAAAALDGAGHLCLILQRVVQVGPDGFADQVRRLRWNLSPPTAAELGGRDYVPEHAWSEDMERSGLFGHVRTTVRPFTRLLSASDFVEVSNTYGPNSQLTAGQREELGRAVRTLIDSDCGGVIEKTEEAVLIVARKLDR